MQTTLEDRQSIADLIIGWIHRDLAEWDKLRELFHPDATIEISWFEGLASDFVDGSMRMGKTDLGTKHFISAPVVTFNGDKGPRRNQCRSHWRECASRSGRQCTCPLL